MSNEAFAFRPSGLIDFEQVEPETMAHQAHVAADDALDTDPLSINFGRRRDCKATASERLLAGITIDWLVAFPLELRPKLLCERFAHVANRLAKDWPDGSRSTRNLRVLTDDPRWGSAGFPAQVQHELQCMLRQLAGVQHAR